MNEGEITGGEFVEAAEDATEVLELAEEALDSGAFLVEAPIGGARSTEFPPLSGNLSPSLQRR